MAIPKPEWTNQMKPIRTKYIDPDFRRQPKTNLYCVVCQRDINPNSKWRQIMYELDKYEAVHVDDWLVAEADIKSRRASHLDAVVFDTIGPDCAKKIGLEFSKPNGG